MTIPIPPAPPTPAPEPARPTSWWRRNRLALIALAVVVPVTAGGVGWHEWHQYFGFGGRPFQPVLVEDGDSIEFAGAEWGPLRGGELDDLSGFDLPDGTTVVAVGIPVDPDAKGVSCTTPVLVDQETGREWRAARSEIGLLYNSEEPETCDSSTRGEYELIVPFVVPDDVEGPFWVDVWPQKAGGSFLRFSLEP
ncbi:hypothetical protein [Microbacterium sp. PMB16]|uniref:hypothetical protein n=1 Tax=Microbacterium sp. PMB16 TaxID=3120157 RepID=UPI003F4C65BD